MSNLMSSPRWIVVFDPLIQVGGKVFWDVLVATNLRYFLLYYFSTNYPSSWISLFPVILFSLPNALVSPLVLRTLVLSPKNITLDLIVIIKFIFFRFDVLIIFLVIVTISLAFIQVFLWRGHFLVILYHGMWYKETQIWRGSFQT